jgi:uncharacterized protein YndB with AHSA1/START domain
MMLDGTLSRTADGGHAVAFDRLIDRPVAKVWAALTDECVLKNWLGDVTVELRVGGAFVIRFREMDVSMTGTITALEPERLIEYTWLENYGMPQSLLRWELVPQGDGCRLKLTHSFPPGCKMENLVAFLGGWEAFLNVMPRGADGEFMPYEQQDEKAIAAAYRAHHRADLENPPG